jgi:hypothetical protein
MTQFQESHPDYKGYVSDHFEMTAFPPKALDGLNGLVYRDCDNLKDIVNLVRSFIPEGPTANWGADWLQGDLESAIHTLSRGPLHKFMNAISAVAERLQRTHFLSDLEELFTETGFGYKLVIIHQQAVWQLRDDSVEVVTASVDAAIEEMPDAFEQALAHLEQVKENLRRGDDRSRKDALRDALSAMESLYKQLSGSDDISTAWKALRDAGKWGSTEIVKDGFSIWNHVHQLHPDVRHGQAAASELSNAECWYWIDRIVAFVKFLSKMHADDGAGRG